MKLKRFVAADMRAALSKIKEELGSEAVIMSNKRIDEGVEIIAGVEDNATPATPVEPLRSKKSAAVLTNAALQGDGPLSGYLKDDEVTISAGTKGKTVRVEQDNKAKSAVGDRKAESFAKSLLEILQRQQAEESRSPDPDTKSGTAKQEKTVDSSPRRSPPQPLFERSGLKDLFEREQKKEEEKQSIENNHGISSYKDAKSDGESDIRQVRDEVGEIRKLLQFELAGLIKDSQIREQPVRAMTTQLLMSAGFGRDVAEKLTAQISEDASFNFAWRELSDILTRSLCVGKDEIIADGGVVALIGPAGVGKTTTLAKLAARFVMNYGPEGVAIVTADHYRIGAVEQVKTYGRIMGCTAFAVNSLSELPDLLYTLRDKSLVLVDTAGVGMNDERFGTQLSQLKMQSKLRLRHYLVLPATAQRRVLDQAYGHFADIGLEGVILTKVDESQSLGDSLSLCLKHDLKLSYITDGQRVPEDLRVPEPRDIAMKALVSVENEAAQTAFGME
ncbi:MAG: flagellar biosynthesis protein FlhF [Succinivibrio sp.]|nr:flagellar biosynthesis protein FlhF [Succinivibrio sp.]